jgi:hypothetical protein
MTVFLDTVGLLAVWDDLRSARKPEACQQVVGG